MKLNPLYSSSSGNLFYLEHKNTKLIIDLGVSYKKICNALKEINVDIKDIDGILITHEHTDHIAGVKVFTKNQDIPIYTCHKTKEYILNKIERDYNINGFNYDETFKIKDLEITPFEISHDAIMPCGFYISSDKKAISFATDLGKVSDKNIEYFNKSDSIILESNYDEVMLDYGYYPYQTKQRIKNEYGHLSNNDTGNLMCNLLNYNPNTKFVLSHMSANNNTIDIAQDTISNILSDNGHAIDCFSFATKDLSLEEHLL